VVEETGLEQNESGLAPASGGWFVVNVRDASWLTHETFGSDCVFESPDAEFTELGVRVVALLPGQPNRLYHRNGGRKRGTSSTRRGTGSTSWSGPARARA
jgi:hypothetical protein